MIIMNKHKNDNVYINNKYVMYVMIIMNKHENNNNDTSTINKMPKYSICMQRGPLSLPTWCGHGRSPRHGFPNAGHQQ